MSIISKITLNVRASNTSTESLELEKVISSSDLPSTNLSENHLKQILDIILELLEQTRAKILEEYTYVYELEYKFYDKNNGLITSESSYSFFDEIVTHAIPFDGIHDTLWLFVDRSYYKENDTRFWRDSETPAGSTIASSLALIQKKYVYKYIDFLRTNDMDHEVDQYGDINNIIEKYGVCEETLCLAIARTCSACGQHGSEQFEEMLNEGFLDYIQSNFDLFLEKLEDEHKFKEIWFMDLDYEEFWNPGNMETDWIDTILERLDENQTEKLRLFFKERLA
ncbi:hypothetical protein [Aquimarina litoralis]|uniref:hypothetical protein n=1 Tax=Aquimarina litoralis TaxID=584605 RepID=UPI001C55DF30|nr:hypothetical protein [Aquimarina litoralis]MBW1294536.1 hypothetical protein [Aquimarina litoralis]